jgi:teichuronic acid biosynthesis glycosyltransferase TuaC
VKILVITNLFPYPGNETRGNFITNRLKALKKFNVDFNVFGTISQDSLFAKVFRKITGSARQEKYGDYYEIDGIRYNYLSFDRRLYDIFSEYVLKKDYTLEYAKELANKKYKSFVQEKYDLIHAHGMFNPPAGLVAKLLSQKLNIPYVVTCHGSDINLLMENAKELYIDVLGNADKVIFVSNALLNKAKSLSYSGTNAVVIPNGIDPKIFKPLDKEKIKKELGLNKKVVGFVGGLKKIKRADKLPEIFEYILSKKDVEFLVVGDGELRENVEKECQKRNLNVKFVGRVSQDKVPYYMNAMDVMILPSRNEGWPCVVLEAQACGVPVVGSSNGGIPEAIGDGGMAVEEGEDFEKRFAEAVVEMLKKPIDSGYLRKRALVDLKET